MNEKPAPGLGRDSSAKRYESLLEMIGDAGNPTPLVRLGSAVPHDVALYAKLEWMNPFGSVKDRTAKWMLEGMRDRGELDGRSVLEPTSGNTGIALAAIASLLGIPMTATVPHNMPAEKSVLIRALGADVVPSPDGGERHPMDVAIEVAQQMIAEEPLTWAMPNQYDNPDNATAHYESTGPEIWAQTGGRVDYLFAGLGTGGTVSGAGRFLKEQNPRIQVIAIEPVPGHHISGLKNLEETAVPAVFDRSVVDEIVYVNDEETAKMAARLHADESLFAGSSGAAVVAGALKYLAGRSGVAVAVLPDSSQKAIGYLHGLLGR